MPEQTSQLATEAPSAQTAQRTTYTSTVAYVPRAFPRPYAAAAPTYRKLGWSNPLPIGLEKIGPDQWRWLPGRKSSPPGGFTGADGEDVDEAAMEGWRTHRFKGAANIGLRLDRVIGLDVDGPEGSMVLHEYAEEIGALPPTWTSTSRGPHTTRRIHFYRIPADLNVHGAEWALRKRHAEGDLLPLDILHRGYRYAVVYPSIHPSGEQYRWYDPTRAACPVPAVADLPELPGAWQQLMVELVNEHRAARGRPAGERGEYAEGERGYTDYAAERCMETALSHIRTHPAGNGGHYHDQLYKRAHYLFMFAPAFRTEDQIQALIEQALTVRFGAPDADDLKCVASARSRVQNTFALLPDPCDLLPFDDEDAN